MSQAADELQEKVVTILSLFSVGNRTGVDTGEGVLSPGCVSNGRYQSKGAVYEAYVGVAVAFFINVLRLQGSGTTLKKLQLYT